MILRIDNNEVMHHTNRLRELHKSALPVAIRETLNSAAFDVKKNTMPKNAKSTFTERQPNFFKANSKVEKESGFYIDSMKSTIGFFSNNLKGSDNYAIKDLEQQENSGSIDGKSFIPLPNARKGGTVKGLVKPNYRLKKIREKGIINAKNSKGKNIKEKFVKAAIAAGKDGYVISGKNKVLFRVDSYISNRKTHKTTFKVTPLYSFRRNRSIRVKSTSFMKTSSLESANKMNKYYIAEAEKQIKRLGAK